MAGSGNDIHDAVSCLPSSPLTELERVSELGPTSPARPPTTIREVQRLTVNVTSNWDVPPFLGFSLPP